MRYLAQAGLLAALAVGIAPGPAAAVDDYESCAALVSVDPRLGLTEAERWERFGGGASAGHCRALALAALGAGLQAAEALLDTVELYPELPPELQAELIARAAEIHLDAGLGESAQYLLSKVAELDPDLPDLYRLPGPARGGGGRSRRGARRSRPAVDPPCRAAGRCARPGAGPPPRGRCAGRAGGCALGAGAGRVVGRDLAGAGARRARDRRPRCGAARLACGDRARSRGGRRRRRAGGAAQPPAYGSGRGGLSAHHSAATSGSGSSRDCPSARAAARSGARRPRAHTAAPRISGSGSPRHRSAAAASAGRPELPIAIRTLRRNRARPMRLTGDPAKRARKPASSSAARAASSGFASRPAGAR